MLVTPARASNVHGRAEPRPKSQSAQDILPTGPRAIALHRLSARLPEFMIALLACGPLIVAGAALEQSTATRPIEQMGEERALPNVATGARSKLIHDLSGQA